VVEVHIGKQEEFTVTECLIIAETIKSELRKVEPRGEETTTFYFNSLLKVHNNRILIENIDIPTEIDADCEFIDIIGEGFYKKLINYASNGLLYMKMEEKPLKKYTFFQWVENNLDLSIQEE
jgi:hypothetical protein